MTEFIQIHWNCGSIDEARKVSRYLVQERLVACANIVPWIESIYMWDNKMETTQETKVIFKTHSSKFEAVKKIIKENTRYEVPEILKITIDGGNQEYLDWLSESTLSKQPAGV